jgi:predicted ATPase
VQTALGKNNVSTYWTQLTSAYNALPLSNEKVQTDLNAYVTQKAIDGLFVKVADEELKIRQNIGNARSSGILDKVFGWVDGQK